MALGIRAVFILRIGTTPSREKKYEFYENDDVAFIKTILRRGYHSLRNFRTTVTCKTFWNLNWSRTDWDVLRDDTLLAKVVLIFSYHREINGYFEIVMVRWTLNANEIHALLQYSASCLFLSTLCTVCTDRFSLSFIFSLITSELNHPECTR